MILAITALKTPPYAIIHKEIGETPLEAITRFHLTRSDLVGIPMTYAGRLDPMASGELLILLGDECKKKDKYLKLDKEYEIEAVFGISTDTYDALGIAREGQTLDLAGREKVASIIGSLFSSFGAKCPTTFTQEYPPYSSKTVDGIALHAHSRKRSLPAIMPTKEVTIYSCEIIERSEIDAVDLFDRIRNDIAKVKGDFRQQEILETWENLLDVGSSKKYPKFKLRVKCSSGTYMRSLAHRFGQEVGVGAFALSIRRTKIFL